jgi:serine/threonine-protein kinase ATR
VTGVEGVFRGSMEVVMALLRQHKDSLLSILEPFLRDPTVAWSRTGRAQRTEATGSVSGVGGPGGNSVSRQSTALLDREMNSEAKEALIKISGRLDGIYNISHPHSERIRREIIARIGNIVSYIIHT